MKKILRWIIIFFVAYLAAWSVSYILFMGCDVRYFFEYLILAWTFNGGELPSYIWLFSIIAFLPMTGLLVFLLKRYERRKNQNV